MSVKLKANAQVDIVQYFPQLVSLERLSELGNLMLYWEQNQNRWFDVIHKSSMVVLLTAGNLKFTFDISWLFHHSGALLKMNNIYNHSGW